MWDSRGVEVDIFVECNVPYMDPARVAKAYAVAGKVIEVSEYGDGRSVHPDAASSVAAPIGENGGAEGPAVAGSVGVEVPQGGSAGGDGVSESVEGVNGSAEGAAVADPVVGGGHLAAAFHEMGLFGAFGADASPHGLRNCRSWMPDMPVMVQDATQFHSWMRQPRLC